METIEDLVFLVKTVGGGVIFPPPNTVISLNAVNGAVTIGGEGVAGEIGIRNESNVATLSGDASTSELSLTNGDDNVRTVHIQGRHGNIVLGGAGHDGDLRIMSTAGTPAVVVRGGAGELSLATPNGGERTIWLDGATGDITVGSTNQDGDVNIRNAQQQTTIHANGGRSEINLRNGAAGNVRTILLNGADGNMTLGGMGHDGDIFLNDATDTRTIHIDGGNGDIVLANADCAEDFELADEESAEPGSVLVFGNDSVLQRCSRAYDSTVAGVVSGAGEYRPGIVLGRSQKDGIHAAIALIGKVCCKVDAEYGAIKPGDLLTSSPRVGHAMKAADRDKAHGAVLGKAIGRLERGCGLLPILVTLQ